MAWGMTISLVVPYVNEFDKEYATSAINVIYKTKIFCAYWVQMKFSSESADEFIFKYYPFQVNFPWYFLRDLEVIVNLR